MGVICSNVDEKVVKQLEKTAKKIINAFNINRGNLTVAEVSAALTNLATSRNMTMDALLSQDYRLIVLNAIGAAKDKKEKERKALENTKIGKAEVTIGKQVNKADPQNNRDILYVFTDNLQAHNALAEEGETIYNSSLIAPKGEVITSVKNTSAVMRTDTDGEKNRNAIGIVTKKNAQGKDGKFLNNSGNFEDTEEDFQSFIEVNRKNIRKIKSLLTDNKSEYKEVIFVGTMALDKAGLPRRFAEALQQMLFEELGISSMILSSKFGNELYGLELQGFGKVSKGGNKLKARREAKARKEREEAAKSLEAARPILESDVVNTDVFDNSILSRIFPNIEERMARVSFLSTLFSSSLTDAINSTKEDLEEEFRNDPNNMDSTRLWLREGLNKGTEAEQRVFALENIKFDDISLAEYIFMNIIQQMNAIVETGKKLDSTDPQEVEDARATTAYLLNSDFWVGREFKEEVAQNQMAGGKIAAAWSDTNLTAQQIKRMRSLSEKFGVILSDKRIFPALIKEVAFELEFNENIRISAESFDSLGGYIDIQRTTSEEEADTENEEGTSDNRSGLNLVKYKLLDPAKTLSVRMKTLLAGLYKLKNGKFIFDDLGQRVRMNPALAYYILIDEFSKMNRPEDLETYLDKVVEKYPWFETLVEKLDADRDLKNEFFTAFRKVLVQYGMISPSGFIKKLNKSNTSETFLDEMRRNYEGHNVFSENSIYNENGECVERKVSRLYLLCTAGKGGVEKNKKDHPFYWIKQVLSGRGNIHNIENLFDVLDILSGESESHPNISLKNLLNDIGVDTTNLDIDGLVPYIDKNEFEDAVLEGRARGLSRLEVFETFFTKDQQKKINDIIGAVITITNTGLAGKGFSPGDHLIDKFQNAYLQIGTSLTVMSESYTQATFRFGAQSRFSYAAPDFISIFTGTISDMSNIDYGTKYIDENYGRFNFFRDQETGEWLNDWLRALYEEGDNGDYTVRRNLEYINILGIGGNKDKHSIGKVNKQAFKEGIITAMFSAQNDKHGNKYGYFRNPLFSDTDALVLLKMPRYSGPGYRETIIKGLVKNLRQEIERIRDVMAGDNEIEIEFFNEGRMNALKFCFFPELNNRKDEILAYIDYLSENHEESFEEMRDSYLYDIIEEMMEEKVAAFIERFDDRSKERIYSKIVELEKKINKEDIEENEDEEDEEDVDPDRVDPEDVKKKPAERPSEEKVAMMDAILEEFYYNDYFGQTQFLQILGGDLAYFKNYDDFVKRCKESYACGERLFGLEIDDNGDVKLDENGEAVQLTEKCAYFEDLNMASNTYDSIKQLLSPESDAKLSPIEKDLLRGAIAAFKDICSTDGQSFRSFASFRKIFKAMGGKWTDEMEAAFNNIESGNFDVRDVISLINPIKPFLVSYEAKMVNGRMEKVGVQHKNSEYLISAAFSVINTALNRSPELVALNRFMNKHNIDVIHFHSVVKHGYHSPFDINYDIQKFEKALADGNGHIEINGNPYKIDNFDDYYKKLFELLDTGVITQKQYNSALIRFKHSDPETALRDLESQLGRLTEDNAFHVIPLNDLMIVQPTGDHLIGEDFRGEEAVFGSQLRNIIPADLPKDFSITLNIGGEEVTLKGRDEVVKFYNTLIVDQLLDSFGEQRKKFANLESLKSSLEAVMRGNPKFGDDVKNAIELTNDGTDFVMPFNAPNLSNKIDELIFSSFKNAIQRQKIKGGNVVLVSNFGLSDSLHVKYKNDDPEQGVEYIPAYMPAYMRDMYEDYLVEESDGTHTYWTLDYEALVKNNEEDILKIIGYRIPTEDKYSIMPIKIMGFMPTIAGSTIMLPSDIITMSGTDFDIDKLFLMIRTTRRETYGKNLARGFRSWIEDKKKVASSSSLSNIATISDALMDLIKEVEESKKDISKLEWAITHMQSFTDDEIESLRSKSEIFDEYMREEGFNLRMERPRYVVKRAQVARDEKGNIDLDATSLMANIKSVKEKKELRDNLLIDVIWNVLTSPEGSKLSMQPGNFNNVKLGSRDQRILHDKKALVKFMEKFKITADQVWDKLQSMSLKEMEEFYDEYSTPVSPMDIDDYVNKHQNLMDGNDLIGMFAVNSSSHYKYQFLDLRLNEDNKFYVIMPGSDAPTLIDAIDTQNSPISGVRIGRICSEFQAASPDNGKDPCLGDLGANAQTVGRINVLSRMGFDPRTIGLLNTADDLRNAATADIKSKLKPDEVFSGSISKVAELIVKLRTEGLTDDEDLKEAAKFARWMDNIDRIANVMKASNAISRVDSPNGALAISSPEVAQQILKAEDFAKLAKDPNCPVLGLDKLIDISLDASDMSKEEAREEILKAPIPRLQAAYTLGIKSAVSLSSNYITSVNPIVMNAIRILRRETKSNLLYPSDIVTLRKFFSELTMFLLSKDSIFSSDAEGDSIVDKRNYYIHDFPMKMKAFLDAKDKKGRYIHQDIRNLTFIQRLTNGHKTGISFRNVGKISPQSRKHYSEALESMLYHPEKEVRDLGVDLLMYSYYDNGLNFGHSNFGIFFTTNALLSIPRVIDTLKKNNGEMLSDPKILENFVYQFLLNHPDLVPFIKSTSFVMEADGNSLIVKKDAMDQIRSGIDSTGGYLKFIVTKHGVFELQSADMVQSGRTRGIRYTAVEFNKFGLTTSTNKGSKKDYTPLYNANLGYNEIGFNDMLTRGGVVEISPEAKKASAENSTDVPGQTPAETTEPTAKVREEPDYESLAERGARAIDDSSNTSEPANLVEIARALSMLVEPILNPSAFEEKKTPKLTDLKDIEDPENKMCPPKNNK